MRKNIGQETKFIGHELQSETTETFLRAKHYIKSFPQCVQRLGRIWLNEEGIYRAVSTCGGMHEITVADCLKCKGFTTPMLKNEIKGFEADDYKLLFCLLDKRIYGYLNA